MVKYLIGIDRGNSGIRSGLYDEKGRYICGANVDIELYQPRPGEIVCKDGALKEGLFKVLRKMVDSAPKGFDFHEVVGISFSMAGGMITGFDENWNMPLETIFAGDCRRNDVFKAVPLLEAAGISNEDYLNEVKVTPPWILSDLLCILEKEPAAKQVKKWTITEHSLILRYLGAERMIDPECGGSMHYNYNPITRKYVQSICEATGIFGDDWLDMDYAGKVIGHLSKEAAELSGLAEGIPLIIGTNDMIPIVIAQGAVGEKEAISNYGTFGTIGKRVNGKLDFVPNANSTHSLHVTGGGFDNDYQVGAIVPGCGASYKWLNNIAKEISGENSTNYYEMLNTMANDSPIGSNGVIYSPFIIDGNASFSNLNTQVTVNDLVRSVMEGIAYEMLKSLKEVEKSIGIKVETLYVSGGLTKSDAFVHMLADMYGITIAKATVNQDMVGTKGAAMIAAIGAGIYRNVDEAVKNMVEKTNEIIVPDEYNHQQYLKMMSKWN